jgi:hypothetical protein
MARVRAGRNRLNRAEAPDLLHLPLPPEAGRCRAETFDGIEPGRCTRPASFLRDGLAVCRQHA